MDPFEEALRSIFILLIVWLGLVLANVMIEGWISQ